MQSRATSVRTQFQQSAWTAQTPDGLCHGCPSLYVIRTPLAPPIPCKKYPPPRSKPCCCDGKRLVFCRNPFLDSTTGLQVSVNTGRIKLIARRDLCRSFASGKTESGEEDEFLHCWFFLLNFRAMPSQSDVHGQGRRFSSFQLGRDE